MDVRQSDQHQIRLSKRAELLARGLNPYPARLPEPRTHFIQDSLVKFEALVDTKEIVGLCGRIKSIRSHGGVCFADLEDNSGTIQLLLNRQTLGTSFDDWGKSIDLGDFIEARGRLHLTQRQEKSLRVKRYFLLTKALAPLPEKRKGLTDTETRFRHRELDLLSNPTVKQRFVLRAGLIKSIRNYFDQLGYLEVETPILQALPGGANARPFKTHHDALDIDLYLRIAPELYLKRLLVGGYERVYEIGRCFRNEGIDRDHSPEFTQVEFYQAYEDYQSFMGLIENLISKAVKESAIALPLQHKGQPLSLKTPFEKVNYRDALLKHAKIDIDKLPDVKSLGETANKLGVDFERSFGRGKLLDAIFKYCVRPKIIQPTFVIDLPIELSPLAKRRADNPLYAERLQLLIAGTEVANVFSELNDPVEQRERFEAQQALHQAGDDEAQRLDEEYLTALNFGLPPTAGAGLGIDRLVAILSNAASLRESILFPTLRGKDNA